MRIFKQPEEPKQPCYRCDDSGRVIWYVDDPFLSLATGHRFTRREYGDFCRCPAGRALKKKIAQEKRDDV